MSEFRWHGKLIYTCPAECTDETPIVEIERETPTREVTPDDPEYDFGSPFVQRVPDHSRDRDVVTHSSGYKHITPIQVTVR